LRAKPDPAAITLINELRDHDGGARDCAMQVSHDGLRYFVYSREADDFKPRPERPARVERRLDRPGLAVAYYDCLIHRGDSSGRPILVNTHESPILIA
jgi:hypothetical protein